MYPTVTSTMVDWSLCHLPLVMYGLILGASHGWKRSALLSDIRWDGNQKICWIWCFQQAGSGWCHFTRQFWWSKSCLGLHAWRYGIWQIHVSVVTLSKQACILTIFYWCVLIQFSTNLLSCKTNVKCQLELAAAARKCEAVNTYWIFGVVMVFEVWKCKPSFMLLFWHSFMRCSRCFWYRSSCNF